MTFSDLISVIWRRKWIIIAVTLLASAVAVGYLQRLTPNFESTTTVRISPQMTEAVNTGILAGIAVDVDPSVIATPDVLATAEKELGVPEGSLAGAISQAPVENPAATTTSFTVTASAGDPATAQRRAAAAAMAYSAYLDGVSATTQTTLSDQLKEVSAQVKTYQDQVDDDPLDQLAQTNLTTALTRVNALNASITSLQTAGPPATVTSAASPGQSTNPTTVTVAGTALVSGLLAGLGLALTREHFDTRIRRTDEIERTTSAPVLAQLPRDRRAARSRGHLPGEGGESSPLSESLRSLRTTLQVALPRESGILVVTSVEPGDGKTFVSANLAAAWARTGRRVVLVAGDLRRPGLDAYFPDSTGGPGLGGLLSAPGDRASAACDVDAALQPTAIDGLRVLPPGDLADDPADVLATSRMHELLLTLKDLADIVIVDTPPALALADASMVASHADGVIVLASMNRTRRPLLAHVFATLSANGALVLGTVANRSRQRLPRSYAEYYLADQPSRSSSPEGARIARRHAEVETMDAATRPAADTGRERILIVCTANESRSPLAAALLRAKTRNSSLEIESAGTRAMGRRASQTAVLHAAAAGLDLGSHTSAQVDPATLGEYDLILAVARENGRSLLEMSPDIAHRLFTVRQFARWISEHERPAGVPLGLWLDEQSNQSVLDFLGDNRDDDIEDPTGRAAGRWKTMTSQLDFALGEIASGLYPDPSSRQARQPVAAQRVRRS